MDVAVTVCTVRKMEEVPGCSSLASVDISQPGILASVKLEVFTGYSVQEHLLKDRRSESAHLSFSIPCGQMS